MCVRVFVASLPRVFSGDYLLLSAFIVILCSVHQVLLIVNVEMFAIALLLWFNCNICPENKPYEYGIYVCRSIIIENGMFLI